MPCIASKLEQASAARIAHWGTSVLADHVCYGCYRMSLDALQKPTPHFASKVPPLRAASEPDGEPSALASRDP